MDDHDICLTIIHGSPNSITFIPAKFSHYTFAECVHMYLHSLNKNVCIQGYVRKYVATLLLKRSGALNYSNNAVTYYNELSFMKFIVLTLEHNNV